MKRILTLGLPALLSLALLSACSPAGSATLTPEPTPTAPYTDVMTKPAQVTSIDLLILESFPVQVHAAVKGDHPDACTSIGTVNQRREGNTFYVEMFAYRPLDMACAQVITPFEHTVALDVVGLPAGTYTVDVNGVTGTFKLDVDNKLP
jgi:inhibitor of cysteine peptidase